MNTVDLIVVAIALAMDAVAVSLALGLQLRRPSVRDALLAAGMFGLFQALMPVLGFVLAFWFADAVGAATPWIAFVLLAAIGAKMIHETFSDEEDPTLEAGGLPLRLVLVMAVATSIDAAAVGVTFAFLDVAVAPAVVLIGLVTFALSLVAVYVGARLGEALGRWATLLGGVVLIGIGLRILLDHLLG